MSKEISKKKDKKQLTLYIVMYRFYEMILWLIFLLINIPYTIVIIIPYLITGKDFITPLGNIYEKCLFSK